MIAGYPELNSVNIKGSTNNHIGSVVSCFDGKLKSFYYDLDSWRIAEIVDFKEELGGLHLNYLKTPHGKKLANTEYDFSHELSKHGLDILTLAIKHELRNDFYVNNNPDKDLMQMRCLISSASEGYCINYEVKAANKAALHPSCADELSAVFDLISDDFDPKGVFVDPEVAEKC